MCDRVFHSMKLRVSKKVKSVARKLRFVGTPDKEGKTDEDIINKNYTVAEVGVRGFSDLWFVLAKFSMRFLCSLHSL